jgi:hypothetical protein
LQRALILVPPDREASNMRVAKSDAAKVALAAVEARRDQADQAIKSAEADVERTEAILVDLVLVARCSGRVQDQPARAGEVVGVVAADCRSNVRTRSFSVAALQPFTVAVGILLGSIATSMGQFGLPALLIVAIMQVL